MINSFLNLTKKCFFTRTHLKLRNRNYNFYDVLGVDSTCTNDEIKQAYLQKAKQYHPDVNKDPGSDEKFKMLTLAYEALNNQRNRDLYDSYMYSDPYSDDYNFSAKSENENNFYQQKTKYDNFSREYKDKTKSGFWEAKGHNSKEDYEEEVFNDFEKIFKSGFTKHKPNKGQDILLEIQISFEEAYKGVVKGIIVSDRKEKCKACNGTRSSPGFRPSKCFNCKGTGDISGALYSSKKCSQCKGSGLLIKNPCK